MKVFWAGTRLGFGSTIRSWHDVRRLHEMGVTHVINLRSTKQFKNKLRSFHGLWLPFPDDLEMRPRWFYRRALHFYGEAKQHANAKVLAFCHHGLCRSPSLVYFLLRADGATHGAAQRAVLKARSRATVARAYREGGEIFLAMEKAKKKLFRG
jgi:protein-tyrosine phosphatase